MTLLYWVLKKIGHKILRGVGVGCMYLFFFDKSGGNPLVSLKPKEGCMYLDNLFLRYIGRCQLLSSLKEIKAPTGN
jgi:hypothetical protein